MLTPEQFFQGAGWLAIGTLAFGLLTAIAFFFNWGIRFRLVGATGFIGVLTVGFLGLSFQPLMRTVIPGALPYNTVFDSGAYQVVIAVPNAITESELDATLRQAASDLLKPSRIGGMGARTPSIRARTIVHQPGISELVYVGKVTPGMGAADQSPVVEIYSGELARASRATS